MSTSFQTVGLIGRLSCEETAKTICNIIVHLKERGFGIAIDTDTATVLPNHLACQTYPKKELGQYVDLVIVVGGDGSLLSAARAVLPYDKPLIGVNRGQLGFLTDIHPEQFAEKLDAVLAGHYIEERRFLLQTTLYDIKNKNTLECDPALNDVVLSLGEIAHLIDFDVYINDQLMSHNRSDGLIIATPTGSTAYALSAGGPILHPKLDAIVLTPMFPHTLSSRPIVVSGNSQIKIVVDPSYEARPNISIDGQRRIPLEVQRHIHIQKHPQPIRLIHLKDYHYFATLRKKLGWERKPGRS